MSAFYTLHILGLYFKYCFKMQTIHSTYKTVWNQVKVEKSKQSS